MRKALLLVSILLVAACDLDMEMTPDKQHYTMEDLAETMRLQGIRHVRVEKNPHLTKRLSTPAYDLYLAKEQFIVVEGAEGYSGEAYTPYFRAYQARGWEFEVRRNMLMIARPAASDSIVQALHGM